MSKQKIIFIDRDGTLVLEPEDQQIDSLDKVALLPGVIPALLRLIKAGFILVMVTNQDGLGTKSFPEDQFNCTQEFIINLFASQGIHFAATYICPHFAKDQCACRKPKIGLVSHYLVQQNIDQANSYMIGDRTTDRLFGEALGIRSFLLNTETNWDFIVEAILNRMRTATVSRKTNETEIKACVNLDKHDHIVVQTGISFFDHMLQQLAKHGGFNLTLTAKGDLHIDEHHTVEDAAIVLGEALSLALGDKRGIARYGFLLPMDESLAKIAIDLSGRPYFVFNGTFTRDYVGQFPTEMVSHFFQTLSQSLKATIHIEVLGENTHHMVEAIFKGMGRSLRQAFIKENHSLPSTKGVL